MKKNKPTRKSIPDKYIKDCDGEQLRDYFFPERDYIARSFSVTQDKVFIDDTHPCGELCIYVNGVWSGYIDETFSEAMASGLLLLEYEEQLWSDHSD